MKKKPIFKKILVPLMGLVVIEILILVCTIFGQGLVTELNENEEAVMNGKVSVRKSYLENIMINDWMNVESTVVQINTLAEAYLAVGEISLDTLDDSSEECAPFLVKAAPKLIDMMRANRVTGAFIVLNTEDLEASMSEGQYQNKPGIYLRDSDPDSRTTGYNKDILLERSPVLVVEKLGVATDKTWDVNFRFKDYHKYYDFLYYPFQTAYENDGQYSWKDMGYWSVPYELQGENKTVFSYSVPLMLNDGTVYGVLGVDISLEYLQTYLPYEELCMEDSGAYFIAQYNKNDGTYRYIFGNGNVDRRMEISEQWMEIDQDRYHVYSEPLMIYNSNAPFSHDLWVVGGVVPYHMLRSFVEKLKVALGIAILATLAIGIFGSLVISYILQKPIAKLSQEMQSKDPRDGVELQPTGIKEIDQMSMAVERLSREAIESGKKFSKIIEMASVKLAGFQIDRDHQTLFLTDHFFKILGRENIDEKFLTIQEFDHIMHEFGQYFLERDESVDGYIFRIPAGKEWRFVRIRVLDDGHNCYGLAEDVTHVLLEKKLVKHERDHDLLTNLYNRRAFRRILQELLNKGKEKIKTGAFLMLDLDNLKYVNDTYGHEYGDRYIEQTALAMKETLSGNVIYARISGDEFNVFLYGFHDRKEIKEQISKLKNAIDAGFITLPDGRKRNLQASGGVSWYPEDGMTFEELFKYADYTMYAVKKEHKGEIHYFDKALFEQQDIYLKNSAVVNRMFENCEVYYAFQPIVDAHTGEVFAYEALMRPDVKEFLNVQEVLEIARRDGILNKIEEMTWFMGVGSFVEHIQKGQIAPDCCLFVNSIPNQRLSPVKEQEFQKLYGSYMRQLVMELTESEEIEGENWSDKQKLQRALGGKIALDDYGTGYNNEKTLLTISPDFIKVDIAIVRDIHKDPDKRTIMEYIVDYAHARGKFIIAEGVETEEEERAVISLGADYLQGYYLAKPQRVPDGISRESREIILEMQKM